jgi:hypothetical protein
MRAGFIVGGRVLQTACCARHAREVAVRRLSELTELGTL